MLAKFENGYYLEVVHNKNTNEYNYEIYDDELDYVDDGWTEYRDIEMYYPMNLIDYILKFCKPDDVEGKYEILSYETMNELLESLKEDPDGEWILERQGTDNDDIRYYKTKEAARTIMLKEIEEYDVEYESFSDTYFEFGYEEFFQSWNLYKKGQFINKKDELLDEIEMELSRADIGISQYAYELLDTDVARNHLEKIKKLINELKEVI